MNCAVTYQLPESLGEDVLEARLASVFTVRSERLQDSEQIYYDTFDWRVYRDKGALSTTTEPGGLRLRWEGFDGQVRYRSAPLVECPSVASALPPGQFREALTRVTSARRLLPLVRLTGRGATHAVLDRRAKTVVRLTIERRKAFGEAGPSVALPPCVRVVCLTGYETAFAKMCRFLEREFAVMTRQSGDLTRALIAIGRTSVDYTGKLSLSLTSSERADRAVRRLLVHLFEMMVVNEDGLRLNLDTEFLHDFRVNVRRTRSCLGQLKSVFDEPVRRRFADEFAWLGKVTGPTRDLDVYQAKLLEYRTEFPAAVQDALVPLGRYLRARWQKEHAELTRALGTKRYATLKREWGAFLGAEVSRGGRDAGRPIKDVATERVARAYNRVRKSGRRIDNETPATVIHTLRIDCKKLRYLLEFFRSVFDEQLVAVVVRSLKRLQDDLGEFNDLEVQGQELSMMADDMVAKGAVDAPALLAMGRLVVALESRQDTARKRLGKRIAGFVDRRTAERFGALLDGVL
jgi:CHAD domain-containing protein